MFQITQNDFIMYTFFVDLCLNLYRMHSKCIDLCKFVCQYVPNVLRMYKFVWICVRICTNCVLNVPICMNLWVNMYMKCRKCNDSCDYALHYMQNVLHHMDSCVNMYIMFGHVLISVNLCVSLC